MEVKVKRITPMHNKIVTTMNMYTDTSSRISGSVLIDASKLKRGVKEYQTVIAVGDLVRRIKVGDMVCINPARYEVKKYAPNSLKEDDDTLRKDIVRYHFNVIEINGEECLFILDSDVDFIVEEYEEVDDELQHII